jgi:WD40 repeat protein
MWAAPGTGDRVRGLAFSEQSDLILAVYEHSFPAQREASTGILVRTGDGHFVSPVCLAVLAEKQLVLAGGEDHILRLWHGQERYPAEIPFYNRLPTCCALTPDGTCGVVGCNEGTIYFISIPDGRMMREFRGYRQAVTACALSPDGSLLASTGGEGAVTLRAVPSGRLTRTLRRPAGAFTALFPLSGPGGAGLVAGTAGGTACIFSSKEGMLVRSLDMYTPSVRALAVSPDGTCLACAGSDASLRIWDLEKGGLAATCETPSTTAKCLAFLPDSAGFVSGGWDGVVRIWGTSGGKPSAVLAGHSSTITCCCVDPTGRLFATGSNDSTLRLWLLPEGTAGPVLCEADKEVSACAISPGGNFLAAAGTDPVIRLYHLPEGIFAGTIPQIPGKPTVLVFSEDGESLIAGYDHGLIAFYSVHGRTLLRTRSAHTGAVTGLVPLKGEDCIATSGADGMIHIFRIPFMRPLSRTTLADLVLARELEQQDAQGSQKEQWKFLLALLSLRFQNEIELCPLYQDAGIYDIQIVG